MAENRSDILLEVKDLKVHFQLDEGLLKAVDGVDFVVREGKTLGIVGESGCGKSVTSLAIMGLLPDALAKTGGRLVFEGNELPVTNNAAMRRIRGEGRRVVDGLGPVVQHRRGLARARVRPRQPALREHPVQLALDEQQRGAAVLAPEALRLSWV